ncbi:chemotaxis protein CheX [Piscinibacter sp.]|jgi:chemotaxis protein CheX|uniref:chemotaxis protein CheX n=1 Tax=Piscinibacter sp. TaxID=1903157 RepID=UPI002F425FB4
MAALNESDLRLFIDSVTRYFSVTSRTPPQIAAAFLGTDPLPTHDFNGIVSFSGRFTGQVIVSLPAMAVRELLVMQHETDLSENNLLDAVGEIANTLAGNARQTLGSGLEISVPVTMRGRAGQRSRVRHHPYVISFRWNTYPGLVCVDLDRLA